MENKHEWCRDYSNVLTLARHLNERCEFYNIESVLEYFAKPWKWTDEWNEYRASHPVQCHLCGDPMGDEDGEVHLRCSQYENFLADAF